MKIFVHINNSLQFKTAEVNENQKIGHLVKEFAPDSMHNQDFMEDVEVYLENQDDDFDKGITIEEAGIKPGDHVFVGKCKKIPVNVSYNGRVLPASVSPATSIKKLKKLSLDFFNIDQISGAELLLWFNNQPLDSRQLVGSLTDYPTCGVDLVLATKNDIQGDLSYDLLQDHLGTPEYLSVEMEGRWGSIINENGPSWPVFFFWVASASGNSYDFKFDLTGYPNIAPTAVLWNLADNTVLTPTQRPTGTKRTQQAFKQWGKECNYLPCDRLAFEGHPDWPQLHSSLIWNSQNDTIVKYLNEVYQILNP